MLDHPELVLTETGYEPPPDGCPLIPDSNRPTLPMPWGQIIETYVPPGQAEPTFALDYEVWPLASVDRLVSAFDFDARVEPADAELQDRCPSALFPSFYAPNTVANDVVRVRISAVADGGHGRSADIFVSRGSRSISVPLAGLDLSSTDPEDRWVVAYEPAAGTSRLAMALIPNTTGNSILLAGIPSGPGRILVLQTASVIEQPEEAILHAPHGFSSDFAAYSRGWYQAIWLPSGAPPTALSTVVPASVTARYAQLGDRDVSWNSGDAPLLLGVSGRLSTGSIEVECGANARFTVPGFASATVVTNGGTGVLVGPGESINPSTACGGSATAAIWTISTRSLNGRRSDVVIGGAP